MLRVPAKVPLTSGRVRPLPEDRTFQKPLPEDEGFGGSLNLGGNPVSGLTWLADVPTIAESGLPGFEAVSWFAMWAPAGTPPAVVDKINAQAQAILADPGFRAKVIDPQFFEPIVGSPAQFADFIKKDAAKWQRVVHDAGIKVQD